MDEQAGYSVLSLSTFLEAAILAFVLMRHGLLCALVWMISVISPVTGSILRTGEAAPDDPSRRCIALLYSLAAFNR